MAATWRLDCGEAKIMARSPERNQHLQAKSKCDLDQMKGTEVMGRGTIQDISGEQSQHDLPRG